jgi:hypothetical protein
MAGWTQLAQIRAQQPRSNPCCPDRTPKNLPASLARVTLIADAISRTTPIRPRAEASPDWALGPRSDLLRRSGVLSQSFKPRPTKPLLVLPSERIRPRPARSRRPAPSLRPKPPLSRRPRCLSSPRLRRKRAPPPPPPATAAAMARRSTAGRLWLDRRISSGAAWG